jgi:hypothetical protein
MPQGDAELMAKEQVLGFEPARRQEVDDEHCERIQEREHRPRSCGDPPMRLPSRMRFSERTGYVCPSFLMRRTLNLLNEFRNIGDDERSSSFCQ